MELITSFYKNIFCSKFIYLIIVGAEGYCCVWSYPWTQTHYVGLPWTRDRSVTEASISTTYNIHKRQAGFEPAIPANEPRRNTSYTAWPLGWAYENIMRAYVCIYTGCPRMNVPNFGRVFLMLNYTDITQNNYIQSWTVTEIMAIEMCGLLGCPRTVRRPWRHTRPMRVPRNQTW